MKNLLEINGLQKTRYIKPVFVFVLFIMAFAACKKETAGEEVSVEIQAPANGAVYQSGDTVQLKVYARDNEDLHEMSLEIKQGNNIMLGMYPYVHALSTYTIDTLIILPTVASSTPLSVEAKARDHESHSANQTINITLNP
jgi:hypothetical protein